MISVFVLSSIVVVVVFKELDREDHYFVVVVVCQFWYVLNAGKGEKFKKLTTKIDLSISHPIK